MEKEFFLLFGIVAGAIAAYVTAKVTTNAQIKIAQHNSDKDITLQREKLQDERKRNEVSIEREKLDILHRILSRVALENSQTMSYMQSEEKLCVSEFRKRYIKNCYRLHEAIAIVDIYYPKMGTMIREIYSQSNIFWGNQENLLRIDIKANHEGWHLVLSDVLKVCEKIGSKSRYLQDEIAERARILVEQAVI